MDLCLGNDDPGQITEIADVVVAEAIFAAEGDAGATLHHNELGADVVVAEGQRLRQSNPHAVFNASCSSTKARQTAPSPIQRVLVVRRGKQAQDFFRAIVRVGTGILAQSGRVGAAQRVSPDPPAEPYVQLSLHTALRCDNTIHVPGIGQASTV
jgi:hypothetical protein